MEENITQRKTITQNIVFITDNAPKSLPAELSAFIAPDGREAREFAFNTCSPAAASLETLKGSHLTVFVASSETDTSSAETIKLLEKKNRCFIKLTAAADELTEKAKGIIASLEKTLDSGFTIADFVQIYNPGIPVEKIRQHLAIFRNGISKISLERPAVLQDGIHRLEKDKAEGYATLFDKEKNSFKLKKFVPASGAASRMFKFLCEFTADFNPEKESINAYMNRRNASALNVFLVGAEKFPFYRQIQNRVKEQNPDYDSWSKDKRSYTFIKTMLSDKDYDYANKPKGILPFHQYDDFLATPVYEHLKEAVAYASSNGEANVHFTISEEHMDGFLDAIKDVKPEIEQQSGIRINITFSNQHKQTDTIAVDLNNNPFRSNDGKLVFRPGGHGALIENLGRLESDIVFIKNIDNVSHNNIKTISLYKKALAGMLIELQALVFGYLNKLENDILTETFFRELVHFAKEKLGIDVPEDVTKYTPENKAEYFRHLLNRPVRICGMVKNEGEPGGGPFWVKGDKGMHTLQIVESSQIDMENKEQLKILADATHFNPVDLVCSLKDYKGEIFDLSKFVDPSTGFIVFKNKGGKDVKSYELPGLWNGAMAGWITLFVEVPLETFNPVKTVNDLLKPAHQPL